MSTTYELSVAWNQVLDLLTCPQLANMELCSNCCDASTLTFDSHGTLVVGCCWHLAHSDHSVAIGPVVGTS